MEAYPLYWPEGRPRIAIRKDGAFKANFTRARDDLVKELRLLGAITPIISSNLMLRQDGLPLSKQRNPTDTGVAVYFQYNGQPMCFACDKYNKVKDNLRAVMLTIEALRGIKRWGTGDMMERAFTGFTALPSNNKTWRDLVAYQGNDRQEAEKAFKSLLARTHPDRGGSDDRFHEAQTARATMRGELT